MGRKYYELTHESCGTNFDFHPTPGQIQALSGGALVKVICSGCMQALYWRDGGLKKIKEEK